MKNVQQHLRDTFLAGIFAGVPIVVTVIIVNWIDGTTQILARPIFGKPMPLLGITMAILCLYLIGLIVRSLIGRQLLAFANSILMRLPVIGPVFEAWKQISLTPGGKEGTFTKVVLVPVETGRIWVIGFTSGDSIAQSQDVLAVFLPNSPNPITGRLYFVPRSDVTFLNLSPEEGLKLVISTGNYIPKGVGNALRFASPQTPKGPTAASPPEPDF